MLAFNTVLEKLVVDVVCAQKPFFVSQFMSPMVALITASGLQGEKSLVDRLKQVREVGKTDP